jgi:hypothetical protein
MSLVHYGKMPGSGWVCTNNRCWLGLSRLMCFVDVETKLKHEKCQGNGGVDINSRCWLGLSGIKCFVAVEAELKTSVPNCSMLKGMHIAYCEILL